MVESGQLAVLVAVAFIPPIVYLIFIRFQERHNREPWSRLIQVFLYGAIVSVALALVFQVLFQTQFHRVYDLREFLPELVLLAVVAAPLIEEFTKAMAVRGAKPDINEVEDGIIYGVAAGLGFSATENLFYEIAALVELGEEAALMTGVIRSITGTFLHATATGIVGYGMAKRYLQNASMLEVIAYYALAVLLHASFNLIAILDLQYAVAYLIIISFIAIRWTVNRIRTLDRRGQPVGVYR